MNDNISKTVERDEDDLLPEYDFSDGVRGKHYQAYRQGHTVTIHKADGSTVVQQFTLEDGAVILDPDVREYFPDSETVNNVLRNLIKLIPKPSSKKKTSHKTTTKKVKV